MENFQNKWETVLKEMQNLVTAVSYDLYIETLEPLKKQDGVLYLLATTTNNKRQLLKLHREKLLSVVKSVYEDVEDITVLEPEEKDSFLEQNFEKETEQKEVVKQEEIQSNLNSKYTFDNFVIGKSNQFCYAASRAVAENPGLKYNPLFIHGGSGLGKTHLLYAIGNRIQKLFPEKKVLYCTSEKFTTDYVDSLRADKKENANKIFRGKYRNVDVLMIDDIQFMAAKMSTQEEFFYTFNDLYQSNKQIVITSDKHPRNLESFEERLRSRFTGGLIQDMQKPDFETRLAILRKKVEVEDYHVMPEVLPMIAEKIDTNIRELEGMLNKTVSLASLIGKKYATISEAEEALKDVEDSNKEQITIDKVISIICAYYNVKKSDLIGKKRNKEIVDPRQICVYIITELLDVPLDSIGKALGGRDHTTIMHARDKVATNIKSNKGLKTTVTDIIAMIKNDD